MRIRFVATARRHRVGTARVLFVIRTNAATEITLASGDQGWLWIGDDQTGDEIEVIGFLRPGDADATHVLDREDTVVIIHAMPTAYRK